MIPKILLTTNDDQYLSETNDDPESNQSIEKLFHVLFFSFFLSFLLQKFRNKFVLSFIYLFI